MLKRMEEHGKTVTMVRPIITTYRDERCYQIAVEEVWASWPAEDKRLLKTYASAPSVAYGLFTCLRC